MINACTKLQTLARVNRLIANIEVAELANGGAEFQKNRCECDSEILMCRYCALWSALRRVKAYLKEEVTS
jgi:hypothetical protein